MPLKHLRMMAPLHSSNSHRPDAGTHRPDTGNQAGVRSRGLLLAGAALAASAALLLGAGPGQPSEGYPSVSRPSDLRELGFAVRGRIGEQLVKPGDKVKAGDTLMRLDDAVQREVVAMYELEAKDLSKIKQAEVALKFREDDLRITKDSLDRGGAGANDLRESQFRRDSAEIELAQAQQQHAVNQQMLKREQANLAQMSMTAPFEGTILEVKKRPGEIVEENTQVLTLVNIDPLWLDVNIPTRDASKLKVGQSASVRWEDLDQSEALVGKVIFISPYGHGGARQIQVRVEVPNPKAVPSGLHGVVSFGPAPAQGGGQTAPKAGSDKQNP